MIQLFIQKDLIQIIKIAKLIFLISNNMGIFSGKVQQEQEYRKFHINPGEQNQSNQYTQEQNFPDNSVKTTSSNIFTFIPLNLFHQMKNLSNVYFLFIAFLQINKFTTLSDGRPTMLVTLGIMMTIVIIKNAFEQIQRYLKDQKQNSREAYILSESGFRTDQWKNIQVGSIIKVAQDQMIPCDLVLLASNMGNSMCFIETKSLDGETSLKIRQSVKSQFIIDKLSPKELFKKHYEVSCQQPNQFLQQFQGSITIENQQISLELQNFIPRGAYLRNTNSIIGLCVYTGKQTKIMMNGVQFKPKISKLMFQVNGMVISIFCWQTVICLILTAYSILEQSIYKDFAQYIPESSFFLIFIRWWLGCNQLIPVSLMVTIQLIKFMQGKNLQKDRRGYVPQYDCRIVSNNTTVNENLGQIRYVFTDKTGTLTKNQMNFKKLVVNGIIYGEKYNISQNLTLPNVQNVDFRDIDFLQKVIQSSSMKQISVQSIFNTLDSQKCQDLLKVMYLCHDIFVNQNSKGQIVYNSGSPDQIALANFARYCGRELISNQNGVIKINNRKTGKIMKYRRLALLQFNSDRKRMSVIVKNQNNQIQLLTKGADSIVLSLVKQNDSDRLVTEKALDKFSFQGLRTLILAKRRISPQQFKEWEAKHKSASLSLSDRKNKLYKCYQQIEKNLQIVGGTGVQDALQDLVSQTIQTMTQSGISFYVLTGDKKQTAISVGRSCGIISKFTHLKEIPDFQQEKSEEWYNWLRTAKQDKLDKVYLLNGAKKLPPQIPLHKTIVYRCTPAQKQNVVKLVKSQTSQLTLAIGDGANDVNMIVTADVGIGVRGKQGTQVTRVADIAIGKFSLLSFLTLYFGRQCYIKNCNVVHFSFFKGWFRVSAFIFYGCYSYFSQVLVYNDFLQLFFEIFFAAIPIFIYGIFDQKYTLSQSLNFPSFYYFGLNNKGFNRGTYNSTIIRGSLYGLFTIFFVMMVAQTNVLSSDGRMGYFQQSGSIAFALLVQISNFRILIMGSGFNPILVASVLGSTCFYWLTYFIYSKVAQSELNNSFLEELTTPILLMIQIIALTFSILGQFAIIKLKDFNEKVFIARVAQQVSNNIIGRLLLGQSFNGNLKALAYLGTNVGYGYESKLFQIDKAKGSPVKNILKDIPIVRPKIQMELSSLAVQQILLKTSVNRQSQIFKALFESQNQFPIIQNK